MKNFNTAGPCIPSDHYMVSIASHFETIEKLINNKRYFSLPKGWLVIFHRGVVKDWDTVGKREFVTETSKQIEVIWL